MKAILKYTLISLSIFIFTVLQSCNSTEQHLSSNLKAIPIDAGIIIETHDLEDFIDNMHKKPEYLNELLKIDEIKNIDDNLIFADSLIKKNKDLFKNKNVNATLSIHNTGKNNIEYLFIINNNYNINFNNILKLLKISPENTNKSTYDNTDIYTLGQSKYYLSLISGVIIFSKSQMLIEKAIRQIHSNASILDNKNFKKIAKTAGSNEELNIYINPNKFYKNIINILNLQTFKYLQKHTLFTGSTELDFSFKKNNILLNGFSYVSDSLNHYLSVFRNQSPDNFNIEEILPANTSMLLHININDKVAFQKDYKNYLQSIHKYEKYKKNINLIKIAYNFNIEKNFYNFFDDEICLVYTDINKLNLHQNAFAIIKTVGKSLAQEKMLKLLNNYAEIKGLEQETLTTIYTIDEESSYPIYTLPLNIPQSIFGNIFKNVKGNYFTFVNNYLIFGNSIKSLSDFIHDNVLHKTLDNDIYYNKTKDLVNSESNIHLYVNIPAFYGVIEDYLSDKSINISDKYNQTINKFQTFIYQTSVNSNNKLFYNTILLNYNPVFKDKPRTVWESKLDTNINFKPQIFINHRTNKKEIFVQDLKNNIYLINASGRILWKKYIGEKILGKVYQVDAYKNRKLQYLFNTKNKLYLIDRNGNFVERYPVVFSSKATAGLGLFDYDKSRDYRILIPDENKHLTLYDISGNIIEGWEFTQTDTYVKTLPQHFRIGDKDYIVFADSLKTYILDRKGHTRVDVKSYFPKSQNIFYLNTKTDLHDNRLITTDKNGNVKFIYFDGTVKTYKFDNFSSNHYFIFKDVDGDGYNDYIFADGNKLIAYNHKQKKILSYIFDNVISEAPLYFQFSATDKKIGVVIKSLQQIYLLNSNSTLYDGFPLKGVTPFSITRFNNSDAEFNLIVGANNSFLYNYKVK